MYHVGEAYARSFSTPARMVDVEWQIQLVQLLVAGGDGLVGRRSTGGQARMGHERQESHRLRGDGWPPDSRVWWNITTTFMAYEFENNVIPSRFPPDHGLLQREFRSHPR